MSTYPYMPLFTDAYMADTIHLDMRESGCYLQLLMVSWRRPNCDLPDDDAFLAKACRLDGRTWKRSIRPVLEKFFSIHDGVWSQKRLQKERKNVADLSEKQRRNVNVRWNKNKNLTDTTVLPNDYQTPTPIPIKEESKKESSLRSPKKETVAAPSARPTDERGHRLTDDWKPSESDRGYALGHGLSEAEIDAAAEEFRNYWTSLPGLRGRKTRWDRTWQNRVKELIDRKSSRNGNGNGKSAYVSPKARLVEQWLAESSNVDNQNTIRGDGIDASSSINFVRTSPLAIRGPDDKRNITRGGS